MRAKLLFVVSLALGLTGCASLLRDDRPEPAPDAGLPDVPDAALPDAPTCEPDAPPAPPQCDCDNDCDRGEVCKFGKCFERCNCDADCDLGEACRWGICKSK